MKNTILLPDHLSSAVATVRRVGISNIILWSLVLFVVTTTVFSVSAYHSPVPYWDMWDGYLDFYTQVQNGNLGAFWAQHNEHRIILSKILFFLDLRFFGGMSVFLLSVNVLLAALILLQLALFAREQSKETNTKAFLPALTALCAIFSFSWLHEENLTWAFQSQFFLAYLMPLGAFYQLYRAERPDGPKKIAFLLCVLLGTASAGTMANGVLVLPLLTVTAMLIRVSWLRLGVFFAASVVVTAAFFHGYTDVSGHGSLYEEVIQRPGDLFTYAFVYVGSPVPRLIRIDGYQHAAIIGGAMFLLFLVLGARWLLTPKKRKLDAVLLSFLIYIWATALATGGGRLIFGFEFALSGRYMTPALISWGVLLILLLPCLGRTKLTSRPAFAILLAIPFLLIQLGPHHRKGWIQSTDRLLGALAIEMGVMDRPLIQGHLYPSAERALSLAAAAREQNLYVFGQEPIIDADARMGEILEMPQHTCPAALDEVMVIEDEQGFVKLRGWLFDALRDGVPSHAEVVDGTGRVVGRVLTGVHRPDVANIVDQDAAFGGFMGYAKSDADAFRLVWDGCMSESYQQP